MKRLAVLLLAALVVAASVALMAPAKEGPANVFAASSLREAFPALDPEPTYNFAGSNDLQLQIERGAPADVLASASPREAQALFAAGRCERPITFATNVLVVLVPRDNPAGIESVRDLARGPRKRIAIGAVGVPIGDYTREVLERLGLSSVLERNVVSSEREVSGITSKVALGSADAGFAYVTDGQAVSDRTRTIPLPRSAQPPIRYQICIVRRDGVDRDAAEAFVDLVSSADGRRVLEEHGFGLP